MLVWAQELDYESMQNGAKSQACRGAARGLGLGGDTRRPVSTEGRWRRLKEAIRMVVPLRWPRGSGPSLFYCKYSNKYYLYFSTFFAQTLVNSRGTLVHLSHEIFTFASMWNPLFLRIIWPLAS